MIEQGEEGEAEESGQDKHEGVGTAECRDERLPKHRTERIDKQADAEQRKAGDDDEGCDALPPFALLLFQTDAAHGHVRKV